MKKIILIVVAIVLIIATFFGIKFFFLSDTEEFIPRNSTFFLDDKKITLTDGISITNSGTVRYFGNEDIGDLNNDGKEDVVFWITNDGGGSGTFYYVVAAINDGKNNYSPTNAFFVGDRIIPTKTNILEGTGAVEITYKDRKENDPMSEQPSVEVTKTLLVIPQELLSNS